MYVYVHVYAYIRDGNKRRLPSIGGGISGLAGRIFLNKPGFF